MFKFCVCLYVWLCVCMHASMHVYVCVYGVMNLNMWKIVICFQKTRVLSYGSATYWL